MDPRAPSGLDQRLYDDFAPRFDWLHEEKTDTLLVDLPGFKKEQLRVQVDNYGNLKISGERQVVGNRWKRFHREFKIPESCNAGEMRARFDKGLLYVIMPKLLTTQAPEDFNRKPQAPPPTPTPTQVPRKPADHASAVGDAQKPPTDDGKKEDVDDAMKGKRGDDQGAAGDVQREEKGVVNGSGLGVGMGMRRRRKVNALNAVAALVVLVAIAVYVVYWWKKGSEIIDQSTYVEGGTGNGVSVRD